MQNLVRYLVVALAAAFAAVAASWAAPAGAQTPLDLLTYEIRTTYRTPDGGLIERAQDAVLLAPALVDVDGDVETGTAGADVLVQLSIDAGRATLRVSALPRAPVVMPLRVEAVLADPRQSSPLQVAYGYDALEDTAPAVFSSTIQLVGTGRVTSFGVDVETVRPGTTLGLVAEVFRDGPSGERIDPQRGRIDLAPVPTVAHFGVLQGSDLGTQQSGVDLATDIPTRVQVVIEDVRGDDVSRGDILIDRLPNVLSLALTDEADGRRTWMYQASERVGVIDLRIRDTDGASIVDELTLRLEDMATRATLIQDSATHATFEADGPIGVVEAGSSSGRAVALLDDPAYVYVTDAGGDSFAFRILGLERAEVDTADPFVVDVTMEAGPFHVLLEEGQATLDGWIRDLPSRVRIALAPTAGTLTYEGSDVIDSIAVDVHDPSGIVDRATDLHLRLDGVPENLSLAWGGSAGRVMLDARPGAVDALELLLTSGPDLALEEGFDGVVLEDLPDRYALAARLTGLALVRIDSAEEAYELELRKAPGPFLIDLSEGARTTRIEILDLPAELTATYDPAGRLDYTGSAPIDVLTARIADPDGVTGRATALDLRLEDIPTTLALSYDSSGGAASLDAGGAEVGLLELQATSGPPIAVDPGYDGVVSEDLPDRYGFAVRLSGLRAVSVTTGGPPYELGLQKRPGPFLVRLDDNARRTEITVHDMPDSLDATLDPAGSLSYVASAPIGELAAEVTDPAGVAGRAVRAAALLRDLPSALDVTWAADAGTVGVDANGETLGLLEVLLTSGPEGSLPDGSDGVVVHDLSDRYLVSARITGLRRITLDQGPPPSFTLETLGGRPFLVDLREEGPGGTATTTASLDALPSSVSVAFTGPTAFSYRASGPVASVALDAYDPDGIAGRAETLHLDLADVPASIDVSSQDGRILLDAHGGTIGSLEIQLTSGPDERIDPAFDGLLLNDLPDRYVLFARVTGLRKIDATQDPTPDILLDTTGGRILEVDLNRLDGAKVESTRATLDRLQPSTRIRVIEGPGRQEVSYSAAAATNSLTFETNAGDRWLLSASIGGPLPANVRACSAGDGYCTGYRRSSGAGSFLLSASEHTTVNLFDCQRPLDARCTRTGSPEEYTRVDDLRVRHVEFDADFDDVGYSGYVFMNTNGHHMRGYLRTETASGAANGLEARFGDGFWAMNRKGGWDAWGLFKDKSGSISCPGTSISVRVFGVWLGVTSYLC